MPDEKRDQLAKILISPRFRYLGAVSKYQNLSEMIPVLITTGLASASHIIVVAREDAQELLAQTVSRIASKDYYEAHQGGTIQINQHIHLSDDDLSELGNLLQDKVSNRLRALGVDLVVYGKFFETPTNRIRLDVYLLDISASALQQAEGLETGVELLSSELKSVVDHLAASIQTYLERQKDRRQRKTFAVLPFRNISYDPKWNAWREGLAEELITVLKNARDLQLIERAATAKYKDSDDLDLAAVGRELGVDIVLWGSYDVFEDENNERKIVVRARLVETETGEVLNTFKEEGKVGYSVQANLAQHIMQELDVQPASIQEVRAVPTSSLDALDYVRIGIHHFDGGDFPKAIQAFQSALGYDPDYCDAHYHLGITYKTLKAYDKALESFKAALGKAYDQAFGKILWRFDTGWKIFASPVVEGDSLYIGSQNNNFYALDKASGDLKWRRSLPGTVNVAAFTGQVSLFAAADQWVFALDPQDGAVRWQFETARTIHADLTGQAETLYVVASVGSEQQKQGSLYALNMSTGEVKWQFDLSESLSAPLAIFGRVAVGASDQNLYLLDGESGAQVWKIALKAPISYTPVILGQILFVTAGDTVYALSLQTGHILWQLTAEENSICSPVVDGEIAYAAFGNKIYSINSQSGMLKWIHTTRFRISSLSVATGLVFATSIYALGQVGEHTLLVVDQDTGQAYWEHTFSDTIYGKPVIQDGVLYIGNRNHYVYAFNIERPRIGLVRSAEVWNQIAQIQLLQQDTQAAIQAYNRCILVDPTFRQAYQGLFDLYRQQKRVAMAIWIQQQYLRRLDEREKAAAELELRQVSGLLWTYDTPNLFALQLVPLSTTDVGMDNSDFSPIVPTPCVVEGVVYIGLPDGSFIALQADTGLLKWAFKLKDEGRSIRSTAAVWNGCVYFGGGDGAIYALNLADGSQIWRFQTEGRVDSTPLVVDSILYVGSDDGKVYALRAENGQFIWSFQTSGRIKSSPVLDDGKVYIGSYDGRLYAINSQSGEMEWEFQTDDLINSSPRIWNGTVYLGPDDNWIHAIDAGQGSLKWKFQVEEGTKSALKYGLKDQGGMSTFGFLPSTPAIEQGMLFVGSNGGSNCKVYALDAETGELKWRYRIGVEVSSPTVYQGVVFVGAGGVLFHDQNLYAFKADEGSLVWRFQTEGDVLSAPTIVDGILYCWSLGGKLFAFDVRGVSGNALERDADFYIQAGDLHLENEKLDLAMAAYQHAINLDPSKSSAYAGLADVYERLGKFQLQIEILEKSQDLNPQDTHTYWRLGSYYLQQNQIDKAINQFNGYIKVLDESKKGIGFTMLGNAYAQMGDVDKALEEYEAAIQLGAKYLDPEYGTDQDKNFALRGLFMAYHAKVILLYNQNLNLAEHLNLELLELAKDFLSYDIPPSYYLIHGRVFMQQGDYRQASNYLEQTLQSDPNDLTVLELLGECYYKLNEPERAIAVFEVALKLSPGDSTYLMFLGSIYHDMLFQFEQAYKYNQQAWEADPSNLELAVNLIEAAFSAGRYGVSRGLSDEVASRIVDDQYSMVARVYACLAALLDGDERRAAVELKELIQFQASLPAGYLGTWSFNGTLKYLQDQVGMDTERGKFILCLIDFSQGKANLAALQACTPASLSKI